MYALPRYTTLHIFTVSTQRHAQRLVVQARSFPKTKRAYDTGIISDLRTASVCFIQEEPKITPYVLNGGGRIPVVGDCPVTTDCLVAMS